jgi:hypothetical protein
VELTCHLRRVDGVERVELSELGELGDLWAPERHPRSVIYFLPVFCIGTVTPLILRCPYAPTTLLLLGCTTCGGRRIESLFSVPFCPLHAEFDVISQIQDFGPSYHLALVFLAKVGRASSANSYDQSMSTSLLDECRFCGVARTGETRHCFG